MYRIKEVAKRKKIQIQEIGKQLGITKENLNSRINKGMNTKGLEKIAKILNCELAELIPVGDDFTHFYDEQGRWLGIMRKHPYPEGKYTMSEAEKQSVLKGIEDFKTGRVSSEEEVEQEMNDLLCS